MVCILTFSQHIAEWVFVFSASYFLLLYLQEFVRRNSLLFSSVNNNYILSHKIKSYVLELLDKTTSEFFILVDIHWKHLWYSITTLKHIYATHHASFVPTTNKRNAHRIYVSLSITIFLGCLCTFFISVFQAAMKMSYNGAANFLSRNGTHLQSTHFYVASYFNHLNAIQWHFIYEYNNNKLKPRITLLLVL